MVALVWVIIAVLLDIATAAPVIKIPASHLFGELQTWTRLLAILVAAPFAVSAKNK